MNNCVIWLTGLSGSGKSTVTDEFIKKHPDFVVLDGDVLRKGLCSDLGFSVEARQENMRRLIELCKLFVSNGKSVITAFISPLEEYRVKAKESIPNCFVVYCNATLTTCEDRDVKGLYKKARAGDIPNFTGIDSPFEDPKCADLTLNTDQTSLDDCVSKLEEFVMKVSNNGE